MDEKLYNVTMPNEKQMNDIKKSDDKIKCISTSHIWTEWFSASSPIGEDCNGNDIETLKMHRSMGRK